MRFPGIVYLCPLFVPNVRKSSWILCLCVLSISCLDQPDCYNLTNNSIDISFRKMFDGTLDTVVMVDNRIVGLDSSFSTTTDPPTRQTFPIDYTVTRQEMELVDVERTRRIAIGYTVQKQFVSDVCTPRFFISNLQNLPESNDSVKILSSIAGEGGPHVAVYRCPRPNIVRVAFQQLLNGKIAKDTVSIADADVIDRPEYLPVSFYPVTGSLSYINLPLQENATTTQFAFVIEDVVKLMTFTYDTVQATVFERCGVQTFITNLQLVSDIGTVNLAEGVKHKADSIYDPPKINFAILQ